MSVRLDDDASILEAIEGLPTDAKIDALGSYGATKAKGLDAAAVSDAISRIETILQTLPLDPPIVQPAHRPAHRRSGKTRCRSHCIAGGYGAARRNDAHGKVTIVMPSSQRADCRIPTKNPPGAPAHARHPRLTDRGRSGRDGGAPRRISGKTAPPRRAVRGS